MAEPVKQVSMNFVVNEKFRRDYKAYAALNGVSMTELLSKSFYKYIDGSNKKQPESTEKSS